MCTGLKKTSRDREYGQEMEKMREAERRTLQGQCRGKKEEGNTLGDIQHADTQKSAVCCVTQGTYLAELAPDLKQ